MNTADAEADPLDAAAPALWTNDALAQFFAAGWRNTVSAFTKDRTRYGALAEVDAVFRILVSDSGVNAERLTATFLLRSHSSFLAAASLGMSGLVSEAYALMRTSLEAALHGIYVGSNPDLQRQWLARNDDDDAAARALTMFEGGLPLAHLQGLDPDTAAIYQRLHARTIHRGSHPNTYADLSRAPAAGTSDADVTRVYFTCDDDVQRSCLRSIAQAGICCLSMFYFAFPERYRELHLAASINKLRQGH